MKTATVPRPRYYPKLILLSVCIARLLFGSVSGRCAEYTITDLGPGVAYDVNSNGQIAAFINGKPVVTDGVHFQFLPYDAFPCNSAIDDAGDILLNSPSPSGPFCHVVNGSTTLLVLTNSSGVTGRDLNNNRLVCGDYNGGFGNAFRSDIGAVQYVSHANSINNQGTIVGMATTNYTYSQFNPYPHPYAACILSNPAPIFIDTRPRPDTVRDFGGTDDLSEALGINDPGEIVGWYRPVAPGPKRAFRYRGQALEDLGTLGGSNSVATHINSGGVVVGWSGISTNSDQHAFIFTNDTLVDLNSFLPAESGWVLQMANSINDSGQIVGYGLFQGVQHAFLFSPRSAGGAPVIVNGPVGGKGAKGNNYNFEVEVAGTPPFAYQWQKNNTKIKGASLASLTLTNLTEIDSGSYRVIVTNATGQAISMDAFLTVVDPLLSIRCYAGLTVAGEIGGLYRIDYTTAVDSTNWTVLTSLQLTNPSQLFIDLETPLYPWRIYRAIRVQ